MLAYSSDVSIPQNQAARELCRQALTQLGYQAESGTWRNEYLVGALELAQGAVTDPNASAKSSADMITHLTGEMVLNYLSIMSLASAEVLTANIALTDDWYFKEGVYQQETSYYKIDYWQGILTYVPITAAEFQSGNQLYEGPRMGFLTKLLNDSEELGKWSQLFALNNEERYFNIIEP